MTYKHSCYASRIDRVYVNRDRFELGGWQALSVKDIFDVEYWELEQAKLRQAGNNPIFQGEIARG